jgi:hypothetical protein
VLLCQIKRSEPLLVIFFFRIGRKERDGPKDAALLLLVLVEAGIGSTCEEHAGGQQEVPHALHWVDGQAHRGIRSICSRGMILVNVPPALVSEEDEVPHGGCGLWWGGEWVGGQKHMDFIFVTTLEQRHRRTHFAQLTSVVVARRKTSHNTHCLRMHTYTVADRAGHTYIARASIIASATTAPLA